MVRRIATAALVLALGACATTDRVTLLEGEAGHPVGAIAVLGKDGTETVLDAPRMQALLGSETARVRTVDKLDAAIGPLMDSLPLPPASFTITFPNAGARIPGDQMQVLEKIRTELARRPGAQIEVAGFTDSTGTEESNNELSRQRALAITQELRDSGFEIADEDAVGRGEYEARAALGDNVADESYRRVDVIIR
ncbi:OmpA family protein [Tsuneonella sp. YG55]|uniref:OmpA family protein n=1 Tax=Tsuneonella litorea TaxID=2976475 RepID=A0A9X3AKW1_9SPHN|nr:OmpA family protein [Tsuneonella litorea]MCT2558438.1 OmpA family protein [Tsuneonella litorea]